MVSFSSISIHVPLHQTQTFNSIILFLRVSTSITDAGIKPNGLRQSPKMCICCCQLRYVHLVAIEFSFVKYKVAYDLNLINCINLFALFTIQLYRYLARRTRSHFNKVVLKRLFMSRINRPPISLSAISKYMAKVADDKRIVVTVGTIVDDKRLYKVPKLTVRNHHLDLPS